MSESREMVDIVDPELVHSYVLGAVFDGEPPLEKSVQSYFPLTTEEPCLRLPQTKAGHNVFPNDKTSLPKAKAFLCTKHSTATPGVKIFARGSSRAAFEIEKAFSGDASLKVWMKELPKEPTVRGLLRLLFPKSIQHKGGIVLYREGEAVTCACFPQLREALKGTDYYSLNLYVDGDRTNFVRHLTVWIEGLDYCSKWRQVDGTSELSTLLNVRLCLPKEGEFTPVHLMDVPLWSCPSDVFRAMFPDGQPIQTLGVEITPAKPIKGALEDPE